MRLLAMTNNPPYCHCSAFTLCFNDPSVGLVYNQNHFSINSAPIFYCPFCGGKLPTDIDLIIPKLTFEERERIEILVRAPKSMPETLLLLGSPKDVREGVQIFVDGECKISTYEFYDKLSESYNVEFWGDEQAIFRRCVSEKGIIYTAT